MVFGVLIFFGMFCLVSFGSALPFCFAAFRTEADIVPVASPFFTPGKIKPTRKAGLCG